MGTDPRKRQKKLERRASKRKEKKHSLAREQNAGLADRLTAATRFPVLHCWISTSLEDQGIGWVVLSRELPQGQVAAASFLVDRYCLGVKNVFAEFIAYSDYESKYARKMRTDMPARIVPPAEARKLLEEAVAYARSLGLPPHADYSKVVVLFGDTDPAQSDEKFEFGSNGKPYFIAGPRDTPQRCREIMAILTNSCGQGNFDFLMPVEGGHAVPGLSDGLDSGKIRRIEETEDFGEDEA